MQDTKKADAGSAGKLFGQDYTTPDLVAKVTGSAKYAEDWKAEGMLFAQAAPQPDAARQSHAPRHERGDGDARSQSHSHGGRSRLAHRRVRRSVKTSSPRRRANGR